MKMKSTLMTLLFFLTTSVWANPAPRYTIVTENSADVGKLFHRYSHKPVDNSSILESIAHMYTLRTTYTIVSLEADAKVAKLPAGCVDGYCWDEYLQATINLNNSGNNIVHWELIDQFSGKVIADQSARIEFDPIKIWRYEDGSNLSGEYSVFAGSIPAPDREFFLDADKKYSISFDRMFLGELYRSIILESCGNDRYRIVDLKYGKINSEGGAITIVPGAVFPKMRVYLTEYGDNQSPYLVGDPGSESPFTSMKVVSINID